MIQVYVGQMRERLCQLRGNYPLVAANAGVSVSWVRQFARQRLTNPRLNQLVALERALDEIACSGAKH